MCSLQDAQGLPEISIHPASYLVFASLEKFEDKDFFHNFVQNSAEPHQLNTFSSSKLYNSKDLFKYVE